MILRFESRADQTIGRKRFKATINIGGGLTMDLG